MGRDVVDTPDDETVAGNLVGELKREVSEGHKLFGLSLKAVGFCQADPNEFLYVTDSPDKPIACVHLTWRTEADPTWPYTYVYSLDEWKAQMRREHEGQTS